MSSANAYPSAVSFTSQKIFTDTQRMLASYRALCSDIYVNLRVNLRMDLPMRRETVLALFERIRREIPEMDCFRRYSGELALESRNDPSEGSYRWLALRRTTIRAGAVNPETLDDALRLHRLVLEASPYFLDLSPLDIEQIELLFGLDLPASGNQNAIVLQALLDGSPLASLLNVPTPTACIDCQPLLGFRIHEDDGHVDLCVEVKTRGGRASSPPSDSDTREDPISVYVTLRRDTPVADLKALTLAVNALADRGVSLLESQVIPNVVQPLRAAIGLNFG